MVIVIVRQTHQCVRTIIAFVAVLLLGAVVAGDSNSVIVISDGDSNSVIVIFMVIMVLMKYGVVVTGWLRAIRLSMQSRALLTLSPANDYYFVTGWLRAIRLSMQSEELMRKLSVG
jgi:hypothetical protein